MSDTQKWYKLHIELLDTEYPNTRDIEVSFVNTVDELHQMIQQLYGLKNCHVWCLSDHPQQAKWEVRPGNHFHEIEESKEIRQEMDGYDFVEPDKILKAENTLLAQFISKEHKTVYYTYDFGIMHQWKITYQGLTKVPLRHNLCTSYKWTYLLEDCPIRELDEYRNIYETKNHKKLKEDWDWFTSRQDFKEYIQETYEDISCEILEEKMNAIQTTPLL